MQAYNAHARGACPHQSDKLLILITLTAVTRVVHTQKAHCEELYCKLLLSVLVLLELDEAPTAGDTWCAL
jgi:hypothetical protein